MVATWIYIADNKYITDCNLNIASVKNFVTRYFQIIYKIHPAISLRSLIIFEICSFKVLDAQCLPKPISSSEKFQFEELLKTTIKLPCYIVVLGQLLDSFYINLNIKEKKFRRRD